MYICIYIYIYINRGLVPRKSVGDLSGALGEPLGAPWEFLGAHSESWRCLRCFVGPLGSCLGALVRSFGSSWELLGSSLGAPWEEAWKASKSRKRKNFKMHCVQMLKHVFEKHEHERYQLKLAIL